MSSTRTAAGARRPALDRLTSGVRLGATPAGRIRAARRRNRFERSLGEVAGELLAGESVRGALSRGCAAAARLTGDAVVVLSPSEGAPIGMLPSPIAARARAAAALDQAALAPREIAVSIRPARGMPGAAHVHVPVLSDSSRLGTLTAARDRAELFSRYERDALRRLARLAGRAWTSERDRRKREDLVRGVERHRVADELHDDVAQILFAAQMRVESIVLDGALGSAQRETIEHLSALLGRADATIRELIARLSIPSDDALAERLVVLAEQLEDEFELPVRLQLGEEVDALVRSLRRPVADALVRVAREALVNAAKHAGPCHALVRLEQQGSRVLLTVLDDGAGVDLRELARGSGGHGLASLRRLVNESGGQLHVGPTAAGGVSVQASFPAER